MHDPSPIPPTDSAPVQPPEVRPPRFPWLALPDGALGARARRIAAFAAGAFATVISLTGIREFDQWHHMAWGRAFLREGFPARDFFLFPFMDRAAPPAPEWLGSVGLYLAWLAGGDAGTVILVALLVGATIAILFWDGTDGEDARWVDAAIALIVVVLAVGVIRRRAVGRPEIFCYPILAWTLFAARRWVEGRGRSILAFPLVALVWTNIHVTVLYGLGAVFVFAAEAWLRGLRAGPAAPERRRGLVLAGLGVAGSAAAFIQPGGSPVLIGLRYGLDMLGIRGGPGLDPEMQKGLDLAHGVIFELQAPALEDYYTALGGLLLLVLLGFVVVWKRVRFAELLLTGLALVFAVRAQRFMPLFAIIAAAAAARNLRVGIGRVHGRGRVALWVLLPLVPAAAAWTVLGDRFPLSLGPAPEIFPRRAADVLVSAGAQQLPGLRVYETFHFGGYLEWRLDAPVIYNDGRLLWPPGDAEMAVQAGGSHEIGRLDARWRFDALVLENLRFAKAADRLAIQALTYDLMADRSVFGLVAIDDGAQLYVRRNGKLAGLLEREYRTLAPSRIVGREQLEDPRFVAEFRREWERAVAENPTCMYCTTGLYFAHLAAGDPDAAEKVFPAGKLPESTHPLGNGSLDALYEGLRTLGHIRALEGLSLASARNALGAERALRVSALASETAMVRDALGRIQAVKGAPDLAEREYRRAIALDPGFLEAHLDLGLLLEATGRPDGARAAFRKVRDAAPTSREGRFAQTRLDALGGGSR